jgi:hypothetical protein
VQLTGRGTPFEGRSRRWLRLVEMVGRNGGENGR